MPKAVDECVQLGGRPHNIMSALGRHLRFLNCWPHQWT